MLTQLVDSIDRRPPAYYYASLETFQNQDPNGILGALTSAQSHDLEVEQRDAWEEEIKVLQAATAGLFGVIYLEFDIPRLGSRIDAVVVTGTAIFPIEFKCGEQHFKSADYHQAWDYALDLKNFHRASHDAPIFPILVATKAPSADTSWLEPHPDGVRPPRRANASDLRRAISEGIASQEGELIDGDSWGRSAYHPTPTIIEAARRLYSRHSVDEISRNDAGTKNLRVTSRAVEAVIEQARHNGDKAIVFVTGVPGAGKTLVGLDVATRRREKGEAHAVFLSGNQPLVAVLQEALTRDELSRLGKKGRKGAVKQQVKPFIQNVHHFRDDGIRSEAAPFDHVVIFDEAQRAWNLRKTADFMKRRKKVLDFQQSEPEFLISYLDRHSDWAVVICLVGGGQEIHDGEAGISAWLDAVRLSFPSWRVYVSPDLTQSEYDAKNSLDLVTTAQPVIQDPRFHLSTSMRSFRSEKVSAFVAALLDRDIESVRKLRTEVSAKYPIAVTRDLGRAKRWIREHARGSERFGLVASSQAQRLKPHAIDVRVTVDPIHWFLNDRSDTRSSFYMEDAATEFQIQGLELDWVCLAWDADFRFHSDSWRYHSFRGDRWTTIHNEDRKRFLLNAYRVLLTRARQGMVICVPNGDGGDPTRAPNFYDGTYDYLCSVGIAPLDP